MIIFQRPTMLDMVLWGSCGSLEEAVRGLEDIGKIVVTPVQTVRGRRGYKLRHSPNPPPSPRCRRCSWTRPAHLPPLHRPRPPWRRRGRLRRHRRPRARSGPRPRLPRQGPSRPRLSGRSACPSTAFLLNGTSKIEAKSVPPSRRAILILIDFDWGIALFESAVSE